MNNKYKHTWKGKKTNSYQGKLLTLANENELGLLSAYSRSVTKKRSHNNGLSKPVTLTEIQLHLRQTGFIHLLVH